MNALADCAARLRDEVVVPLKARYVGREEVVDLIALALVAGEHLFLYGPPGTAKSALIRAFASAVHGSYFEYLLTRFSEPNEIFGPIDLGKLREGIVATVTTGMLPEAEFVFLDELFNANSAILNNLLTVLNERVYRRGAEIHRLPMLSLFSASNHLPEDDALQALFDRFLLRCRVEPLPREAIGALLAAGWELERQRFDGSRTTSAIAASAVSITADDLRRLAQATLHVDLVPLAPLIGEMVHKVRDLGIALSDRRAVKVLKLIAGSAVLCGRNVAEPSDIWVFRYVWDRAEQIGPLSALVQELLQQQKPSTQAHALAAIPERPNAERIARLLDEAVQEVQKGPQRLTALARLREQVTRLADQAAWLADTSQREHLQRRAAELLDRIGR